MEIYLRLCFVLLQETLAAFEHCFSLPSPENNNMYSYTCGGGGETEGLFSIISQCHHNLFHDPNSPLNNSENVLYQ